MDNGTEGGGEELDTGGGGLLGGDIADGGTSGAPAGDPPAGDGSAPAGDAPAGDPPAGDGKEGDKPWFANDWREKMVSRLPVADQAKELARLKRYASPENLYRANRELEKKYSSTKGKPTLPENPTAEDLANYRKEIGVPETPEGYDLKFPDTIQASPEDLAVLGEYAKEMHAANMPPEAVKANLAVFVKLQEAAEQKRYETARATQAKGEYEIKTEYGRDFKRNMAVANQFISEYAGEDGKELMQIMLADGTSLGSNPGFIRMIVSAALANAGDSSLAVADVIGSGISVQAEIDAGLALLKSSDPEDRKKYYSPAHQEHMAKLYAANERMGKRG